MLKVFVLMTFEVFLSTLCLAVEPPRLDSPRPEIIFEKRIELSPRAIYVLGDLVQLKNPNTGLIKAIEEFVIERKEIEAGLSPELIRDFYKRLVANHPSITDQNPKLILAQKTEVKILAGFSFAHFSRKLQNHLSIRCAPCEVKIEGGQIPKQAKFENWEVDWESLKLAPSLLVPIQTTTPKAGAVVVTQWISINLKIMRNALVSVRPIQYGERVSEKDFEFRWVDTTFAKEDPITKESLIEYTLAAKSFQKGKVVFPSDLKKEPAAIRGQGVKVIIGNGEFEVATGAVAEENGYIGDQIKIRNPDTKKIVSATIVEKGVVRIQ